MNSNNKNWCDSRYITPISVYQLVLKNKDYFSSDLEQTLLKNNIYLARYLYEDPKQGNTIFDCLADFLSEEVIGQLRNRQAMFIFDLSHEGYLDHFPIDQSVHNSIKKYNLPADSICVLVGTTSSPRYNDVNFVYYPSLQLFPVRCNQEFLNNNYNRTSTLVNNHHGYYFSAMTCKHRFWRSWGLYHLLHSNFKNRALLTHLHPPGNIQPEHIADYLNKHSPILTEYELNPLDGDDLILQTKVSEPLHINVLFHLAMETCQDADTVFYTEKTYKSLIAETPTIIWGTPGMNTVDFEQWGFQAYHPWFDLSFDQETNHKKRWSLLQKEIERVCGMLDSMTINQRLEWSLQRPDIVRHNKRHLQTLIDRHCKEFCQVLVDYFE